MTTPRPPRSRIADKVSIAEDTALLRGLAGLYFSYRRYDVAANLLDLVLWLDASDKSAHALMARILMRLQRGAEAKSHMDKARRPGRANLRSSAETSRDASP